MYAAIWQLLTEVPMRRSTSRRPWRYTQSWILYDKQVTVVSLLLTLGNCGVTKGGGSGAVSPGCSILGGTKQPHQQYFMTNEHKNEFDVLDE